MPTQYSLFVIATLILTLIISYTAYRSAQLLRTWRPAQNPLLSTPENILRTVLIVLCILLGLLSGLDWEILGWTLEDAFAQTLRGVLWGLGMAVFFRLTTQLVMRHTGHRFYSSLVLELILPRTRTEFLWLLLAMWPVVLLEELLYRSLLIGGLTPLLPEMLLVIVVGIAFGLLHQPQGIWGMFGAGFAGVVFGMLFVAQGSLLLTIVAHYVANIAQIAWVGTGENLPDRQSFSDTEHSEAPQEAHSQENSGVNPSKADTSTRDNSPENAAEDKQA